MPDDDGVDAGAGAARLRLELAVQDPAGARAALACGADRVELCSGLAVGGLTPSAPLMEAVVATGVAVHVLVRPRTGGFVHDAAESELLLAEVRAAVAAGAAGVVLGALDPAVPSGLDEPLLRAARRLAGGVELTFHRACDVLLARGADPGELVGRLHRLGVDRVLTSGGAARAVDGLATLGSLARAASGRVEVMAGSGVRAEQVVRLAASGVDALHASASTAEPVPPDDRLAALGDDAARFQGRTTTDPALAAALARAVREVGARPWSWGAPSRG